MAIAVNESNFKQEVEESTLPVVLDIYATWCGPCQQMEPVFEELEKELSSKCKFAKLSVDEARSLSIKYGVTSVPTFIFIKNNQVKNKETGFLDKEALRSKIDDLLSS